MGRHLDVLGLTVLAATSAACDDDDTLGSGYDAGTIWCQAPAVDADAGSLLPPRPAGPVVTASGNVVLAVSHIDFGDLDSSGSPSPIAWQHLGLNIDGKVTEWCSTNVCTPVPGSSRQVQVDGYDGIDNSFGSQVMPIIDVIDTNFDTNAPTRLRQGGATMLLQLYGLGPSPDDPSLDGALLHALATTNPRWDGTDVRQVDTASLIDADVTRPLAAMPGGYMSARTWVSSIAAGPAFLDMQVALSSNVFLPPLPLQHVRVAVPIAVDGGSAVSGTLSGIIRVSDADTWVRYWGGGVAPSLCVGSAITSIQIQLEQTADIMADGTNAPGQQCDGISVGLGIDAVAVKLGSPAPPPPFVDPCDAGGS